MGWYLLLHLVLWPTCALPMVLFYIHDQKHQKQLALQPKGCRRIGRTQPSNLSDEHDDAKYARGEDLDQQSWKVKALFIHPIKSCAPVELDQVDINGTGCLWDRQFAFAEFIKPAAGTEQKAIWTFRTQRQPGYEKLTQVKPEVWIPDAVALRNMTYKKADKEGVLVVKYPNVPSGRWESLMRFSMALGLTSSTKSFRVPLVPPKDHTYPSEDVVIWKSTPRWLNYGVHVPEDFKSYLGVSRPFSLFRVDPNSYREVHRNAPSKESLGYQPTVGFADAYPVHLLNLASVRDIAQRVSHEIPKFSARRFRANIVITGPSRYDEDDWKCMRIGDEHFHCACHTVRCRLPNVDPDSSERHPVEPDKTLKSFRCIDEGNPKNACLGLMLVPAKEKGSIIRVGDEIEPLERGLHVYIRA